ncbi:hypothetical protein [Streptomyces sp. Ag109_O5-1]|uniref:hypothetical protein n=1 Tax=Streptomyces sp. Ag109_O5-1 TaxID=1938851 RepID=UPI000F513D25|nr:hypothetical protein [Streptomyces sp. Ag109_O5-1]
MSRLPAAWRGLGRESRAWLQRLAGMAATAVAAGAVRPHASGGCCRQLVAPGPRAMGPVH